MLQEFRKFQEPQWSHKNSYRFVNFISILFDLVLDLIFWFLMAGEKRYKCEICSRTFTESSTRSKHMATHGEKQFKCDICEKLYSRKSTLNKHVQAHFRPKDKSADCEAQECPVCFKNVTSDLKRHIKNHEKVKGDSKTYPCKLCNASYNQYNSLRAHMSKHTGKKEYCCDVCSKEFSDNSNLLKHLRIHAGDKR